MPISPAPPSGAKTSSSAGDVICVINSCCLVGWVSPSLPSDRPEAGPGGSTHPTRPSIHPRRPMKREYLSGRNGLKSAGSGAKHQPPRVVDGLEAPSRLPLGKPHPDRLPKPQGAGKPLIPDGEKTATAVPLREAGLHRHGQMVEQCGGVDVGALGGKIRRGKFGGVRMMAAIHPDPDCNRDRVAFAFDQNARDLSPRAQQV